MRVFVFLFVFMCACSHNDLVNQPKQPTETGRDVLNSIVPVFARAQGGQYASMGTGFFVHPHLIATAYHVVDQVDLLGGVIYVRVSDDAVFGRVEAFLAAAHPEKDIAILYTGAEAIRPLTLCPANEPHMAIAIRAIDSGHAGTFFRFFPGIALSGADKDDFIAVEVEPGTSGGPAISYRRNCASGMIIYGWRNDPISGFVKAQEIIDFVNKNRYKIKSKMKKLSSLF